MSPRPTPRGRWVTFLSQHPEWADMAYEVMFRRSHAPGEPLQYVIAQALMAAYAMGQQGRYPPRPQSLEARRMDEPPPDEDADRIFRELTMLAWSPLAGTQKPEGYVQWAVARKVKTAQEAKTPVVVRRQQPTQSARVVVVRRR